jgi:hypothetical protein
MKLEDIKSKTKWEFTAIRPLFLYLRMGDFRNPGVHVRLTETLGGPSIRDSIRNKVAFLLRITRNYCIYKVSFVAYNP